MTRTRNHIVHFSIIGNVQLEQSCIQFWESSGICLELLALDYRLAWILECTSELAPEGNCKWL